MLTRTRLIAAALLAGTFSLTAPAHSQTWGAGADKVTGSYADVNGIKLYYEIRGSGAPLVLLHGGLGAIEMFGPNLPALAKGRRVIAVDLQGHGRTADIDRPISLQYMADDVAALLAHLKIERADVMGYSMGGGVALQVAIRHPEAVNRLIIVSAPFKRSGFYPEMLPLQAQVSGAMAEAMKQTPMWALYSSVAPRKEDFPRLLDKMGAFMRQDYDYSRGVAGIKATTLIVAADADMFPPSHTAEFFALLGGGQRDAGWDGSTRPKSRLAILPGLTHYNIGGDPALAATAIQFLDDPATSAR